ncbi:MAG: hypothetical protein EAX90_00150 [Candidatus Heimdallarchaeota archaeon]|nr:hypothetical protein [Candidatus Heimdallarchaeota archaeon]
MSSKKPKTKDNDNQKPKSTSKTKKSTSKKTAIPKEWKEESKETSKDIEKGKRRTLISTLKRSISLKGDKTDSLSFEAMNIVISLNPAKHMDIIEYIEENVPAGGRPEWVRDSIRLKMRIERGVYGLNTSGQNGSKDSEETLQSVFGQFAEVMTKVMTDLKTSQPTTQAQMTSTETRRQRAPPSQIERPASGGPPQLKKVEASEEDKKEFKPDRPSLDDAIGAIIVVE